MNTNRTLRFFIGFTLVGLAHWFFGNLYETVVFTPNTLVDPATALTHCNEFTQVSNPVWYFIPMCPLTFLASVLAYVLGRHREFVLRKWLLPTMLLTTLATELTVYIVTQINLKVYFSGMNLIANHNRVNMIIWNGLPFGIARLIADAAGLYCIGKAYVQLLSTPIESVTTR